MDCLEDGPMLKDLIAISSWTIRVRLLSTTETIETRIEQRGKTSVDTIKSVN